MKKSGLLLMLILCCIPMLFGSIVTNTNQSAIYIRHLARGASTEIDAVYYNPAGTTKLSDGFHIAIHNQSVFRENTVINDFVFLNNDTYIGKVRALFLPTFFAVYKMHKLAISFGFGPNAGGGSVDYATGLPSFEIPLSVVPFILSSPPYNIPVSSYTADISFNGSSVYYGFQLNASYAILDFLSVGTAVRYITVDNVYKGHIKNIMFKFAGDWIPGTAFDPELGDKGVDVKQTGTSFTPIMSLHINPMEQLSIGVRYEFNTKLELENKTTLDQTGMFPDGFKARSDIPAIFTVGAEYALVPSLRLAISYNLFFEKNADCAGRELLINNNTYDLGFGIELDVTNSLLISAGYLITKFDVSENYQTDLSHEISNNTVGFGARISFSRFDVDLGGICTLFDKNVMKDFATAFGIFTEYYERTTWCFAIGFGYHLTK